MKEVEIDLDDETYKKVEAYMSDKKIETHEQAIQKLVEIGLKQKEKMRSLINT